MYSGDNMEAMPTPTPQTMRYRMNGVRAAGPMPPMGPKPNSGYAEPKAETKNKAPATTSPPLRPRTLETQPARKAPMMQPSSALETVQPERLLRAVSVRCCGSMKLASIELTAPEMTAVS
jgi:hypothetical protein